MTILWLCVGIHLLVLVLDRAGVVSTREVFAYLGFSYNGVVRHLWIHQFLTAALLHGGLSHLVFNMLTLWMLGPAVEGVLGRRRYLTLSLLAAASGFLGFLLFNWGKANVSIGYSGVIFGIMVAQAIYFPNSLIVIFGIFPMRMKHAVLLLSAIELYLSISPHQGGIANCAHLFGALGAFLYLKVSLIGRHIARRDPAADTVAARRELPARDWGQAGIALAAALREATQGNYESARGTLDSARVPWALRSLRRELGQLLGLAHLQESSPADATAKKLNGKLVSAWRMSERKQAWDLLPPLAALGTRFGEEPVSLVLATLCPTKPSALPLRLRPALEQALAQSGGAGIQMVFARLGDAATPPEAARCLGTLLPSMNLQTHASAMMKAYAQASPEVRARWVAHLSALKDNSAGTLCDLLAGVLIRMPPDLSLAQAIQARIGAQVLEQTALRWAAGGHRGAQTVLARLFGYRASSFSKN